jgi:hypothetical protein
MKKYLAFLAIFFVFLLYFVWNSSWHLPSHLVIRGQTESPADVRVSWDSGAGFNDMDSADLVFGTPIVAGPGSRVVRIRRTGGSHPSARSAEVWIKVLKRSEDDHAQPLESFAQQKGVEMTAEGYLRLRADGAELQVPAGRDYTAICFVANEYAGIVEIELDGDGRLYDLYAEQPRDKWVEKSSRTLTGGHFIAKVDLPRYDLHRLQLASAEALQTFRLESVMISSVKGDVGLPLIGSGRYSTIDFSDFSRNTRQYFHPLHLLQQILFAILSAGLILAVSRFVRTRGGIARVLSEGKRPVFWLMFLGGIFTFGAWLLAYWPGHFTSDSVHIWWAAKQPGYFLHDHPVMNVIYYRFLQQFWDHFAVVGIAQIFFTSLLGAYIFYWLRKKGVSLFIVLPLYFLFAASIPIGLYTISLWKDIPFALLVVFWAFWFVKLGFAKKGAGVCHSRGEVIVLSLLLIALGLFRYNGIVYFAIIPVGLALLGVIPPRKILLGSICALIVTALLVSATVILDKTQFVAGQSRFFIDRMLGSGPGKTALRVIRQYPTLLDVNIIKKRAIWYDTWYRDSGVTQWHYDFAKKKGYHEWIRYVPCEPKSDRLYEFLHPLNLQSTDEPWVYFTWNPFYLLFIFPVCLLYRQFPLTAAYGYIVLSQVLILLWVLGPYNYNWRYYYFLLFSLYFLIPVIALDVQCLWRRFRVDEGDQRKGRWFACLRSV